MRASKDLEKEIDQEILDGVSKYEDYGILDVDGNKVVLYHLKTDRKKVVTVPVGKTMCQQQFQEECDINHILKRMEKTGYRPQVGSTGVYADLTQIQDLQTSLETVRYAEESFMALPAELRLKFNNSAVELINFLDNPANDAEAINLGLKARPPEAPASSSNPPAAAAGTSEAAPGSVGATQK